MPPSSIGWGHNPFGNHQFGSGDWAEEMLWKLIPEFTRDDDERGPPGSLTPQPLRGMIDAIKPLFQELRLKFEDFPTLWDAATVPLNQLSALAYNVGISDDPSKIEGLRRSSVLNASQLWLNKGTAKGYQITAAFEGLLVTITPLWAESCAQSMQVLGTVGSLPSSFDLSTTPIYQHPVAPGTLKLEVTTALGLVEHIYDDEAGNLTGAGVQQNGPLTRLNVTNAFTLNLTSILGIFKVGDTLTQGPNTGTILGVTGATLEVNVTVGAFNPGVTVTDTGTGATGVVVTTLTDSLAAGETIIGQTSGTQAVVRSEQGPFVLVDKITTGSGFTVGETAIGQTSGNYVVAGTSAALLQGPLRTEVTFSVSAGTFVVDEQVTGGTSGAVGLVRALGTDLFVDTITAPGFIIGEVLTGAVSGATGTISALNNGTINYLTGGLTGTTVMLAPGSSVKSLVSLVETGPDQFISLYDLVAGDTIPLDAIYDNHFARWPTLLVPVRIRAGILTTARCRSYSLRLFFQKPDDTEIENFLDVATRITASLENFRPIHVRFDSVTFDGSRACSQVWRTSTISAENSAAAAWTASITAEQKASSQVWTAPTVAASAVS